MTAHRLKRAAWLIVAAMVVLSSRQTVCAQTGRGEVPGIEYWVARGTYYDGDYVSARKQFQDAAKSALIGVDGRWVDSACYHTMIGECYYELGDLTQALDQYSSALKMFLAYQNWMLQVEFPQGLDPSQPSVPISWGTPTRTTRFAKYPPRYSLMQGVWAPGKLEGRSVLAEQKYAIPIRAAEIARCTALAIRRRREIMGPTCERDRLTDQVLTACMRRPAPPNNWSQCWASVQLGLAQSAAGKDTQALSELAKGLQAGGTYDHVLTSLALLEMADINFKQGKYETAGTLYLEATYTAAQFDQYDDMEDGFRGAQLCWLLSGKNAAFQPLSAATTWAGKQEIRKLEVALRLLAAENLTFLGDNAGAASLLLSANKAMLRKEMQLAEPGARWNFEMARVAFANGNLSDGAQHLGTAMKFQQGASRWLFQIGLADAMVTSGAVTEREADLLYTELLRDPEAKDWSTDPLESLTVACTSYAIALEHWFNIALSRKEPEKAMEIADRLRRHRFYSTLPLGGRLLALRWILEAPKDALDAKAQLQRQDLLLKYPRYAEISLQAAGVKERLDKLPLLPDNDSARKEQVDLLGQLGRLSATQEVMLRNIALRREPSDYVFPPNLAVKDLQKQLPDRTLVLSYINIGGKLYGFALGKEKYASFTVDTTPRLRNELAAIFKTWGHLDKNQTVDARDLQNVAWRQNARRLLKSLTNNMKDESWANFDEVIVVPDSVLWYLPFEALPLGDEQDAPLMISRVRVRCVPTLALAAPDPAPKTAFDRTAVVAGKLFPRDDLALAAAEYGKISAAIPGAARLMSNLPAVSSLFASQFDQLIVYHDLDETAKGPYDWAPCPVDKTKAASVLAEWFALPWEGPRQVILPGFHTPAEAAFRKGGGGDELFLTSCAFLASGSKTVLLSRWRTAGQTSYDLAREFALESPFTSASSAWQRSVQLAMHNPLDPTHQPRLQPSNELDGMTTSHPFFWSGYLLVDTGAEPKSDKPAKPEAKKPDAEKKPDIEKKPEPEKKVEAEKKPEPEKKPDKPPAKLDEEDGKLPPDLEALRKAPPRSETPAPLKPRKAGR